MKILLIGLVAVLGLVPPASGSSRGAGICIGATDCLLTGVQEGPDSPVSWRSAFRSSESREGLKAFLTLMKETAADLPDDPTVGAFLATAELMTAGRRRNPFAKWSGFRKWTSVLDKQAVARPEDPDIRFLRLTVETSAPGFLGYSDGTDSDCRAVADALQDRFWRDDPDHELFVTTIHRDLEECH